MTKEKLLYGLIGLLFLAYVGMEYYAPKPLSWIPTFDENDINPYGSKLLFDRLNDLFTETPRISYSPLGDEMGEGFHLLIITNVFLPTEADSVAIMKLLNQGKVVFIASEYYNDDWLDGLGLWTNETDIALSLPADSIALTHSTGTFILPNYLGKVSFDEGFDDEWTVLLQSDNPVMLSTERYGGKLILSSTPLLFTNFSLLLGDTHQLLGTLLSNFPDEPLTYNRYFKLGRMESRSPLRYFLSQRALRWAVYLALVTLLLVMFFGAFRKGPLIPLPESNVNATLIFTRTLGGLFYREGKHQIGALKLVSFFYSNLDEKYYIRPPFDENKVSVVSSKTGVSRTDVMATFDLIRKLETSSYFSETNLTKLYQLIRKFENLTSVSCKTMN